MSRFSHMTGIAPVGFRGVDPNGLARLIPYSRKTDDPQETWFWSGVDVRAEHLLYLPDMGPSSAFAQKGSWHHYEVEKLFVATIPAGKQHTHEVVVVAIHFRGEDNPRLLTDRRDEILREQRISEAELVELLSLSVAKSGINLDECQTFS